MAIIFRSARVWVPGVVSCLVLLGPATGALTAGASAAARTASDAASTGRPFVPTPGQSSALQGVACPSATSCWAVGNYTTAGGAHVNEVLHWNGRRWSRVPVPSPGGTTGGFSGLGRVTCVSPASCWAVGEFIKMHGPGLNQALHWDGRRWSLVPTPDPGGTTTGSNSGLLGVRCTSPGTCWAVGAYVRGRGAPALNQVLRWDGRRWSLVPSPDPGGKAAGDISELTDIRCTSPASCWAVGDYGSSVTDLNQVLHWNGRKWSQARTPDPGGTASGDFSALNAVSCPSPASCWAVGGYGSSGSSFTALNEVLHWNGRTWSLASSPDPDGTGAGASNFLSDVVCTSAANCWAVGNYGSTRGGGVILNQALHWDGTAWSQAPTPNPAGTVSGALNFLRGVRCASPASCWAVGRDAPAGQSDRNQSLHWNGSTWSVG
jgi:hypothetical protein